MPRAIQDIMNRELLAIRHDSSAHDALALLRCFQVGAAPVLDDENRPLGVVSIRDLLEPSGSASGRMSRPALCIATSTPIHEAARQLARTDAHHLVVVDGAGVAVGMVSTLDLLRALLDMPVRHPRTFPHYDEATGLNWTDDWPLEVEEASHAPEGAGILALTTGHLGECDSVVWAESCEHVRERVVQLASTPTKEEASLVKVLALREVRFRAAAIDDDAIRSQVVHLMRDRMEHAPPPGAT